MNLMNLNEYEYNGKNWKKLKIDDTNKQNKTNKPIIIKGRIELHFRFQSSKEIHHTVDFGIFSKCRRHIYLELN